MLGDATLFAHRDGVETTWALYTPVLDAWAKKFPQTFPNYTAGTWGPECGDELIGRDGHTWQGVPEASKP
jgi:glucose-6-phosphate 1-dehydrogenase